MSKVVRRFAHNRASSQRRIASLLLASCLFGFPAIAERVLVPLTGVVIDAPENFQLSQLHRGLAHHDVDAVLQIIEVPVSLREMLERNTSESLATRGMHQIDSEAFFIFGVDGRLLYVEQEMRGEPYGKWILMFGDSENSVMVMAHYPLHADERLRETMRRAVLSSRWNSGASTNAWDGLSFRVSETRGLKIASRIHGGVILTRTGRTNEEIEPDSPLYIISEAETSGEPLDLEDVAKHRSGAESTLTTLQNVSGETSSIAGLDAYELTADVIQNDRPGVRRLYKAVVADDEMVFVFQGIVGSSMADEYLPEFRKIAHSMQRVPRTDAEGVP